MENLVFNKINTVPQDIEILIKNASIIDSSQGSNLKVDILIKDGIIHSIDKKEIGSRIAFETGFKEDNALDKTIKENIKAKPSVTINKKTIIIDADGLIACPSFFDMHVHLREPGNDEEEDFESGINAAIHGGCSALCCMPNTEPLIDNEYLVKYIINRSKEFDFKVYPVAAMTRKLEGTEMTDFGLLKENGAIALSDDGRCVQDPKLMYEIMKYASYFDIPLILHEEDYSFSKSGLMHEGYFSSKLGLDGISSLSEILMVQRDIELAKRTKAKVHFTHISAMESVQLIKMAKENGLPVTCDVTPHHLVFDDSSLEKYDATFKINPPLRSSIDRQSLEEGIHSGIIDIIASDHAPHTEAEKKTTVKNAANGVTGLETMFSSAFTKLCKDSGFGIDRLINILSIKPRQILGIKPPLIKHGEKAEITLFDPEAWRIIDDGFFNSKSKNSAFKGKKLYGMVCATVNGKRVRINN